METERTKMSFLKSVIIVIFDTLFWGFIGAFLGIGIITAADYAASKISPLMKEKKEIEQEKKQPNGRKNEKPFKFNRKKIFKAFDNGEVV